MGALNLPTLRMEILNIIALCLVFALSSFECDAVTPVRLVDGPHRYAGRLEVYYQGEWGSVCGVGFDEEDAGVACGMIRNTTIGLVNATILTGSYYGRGNGPVMITNLRCNGSEDDIFFCKSDKWKWNRYCPWYMSAVSLNCNTQVRLVYDSYSGLDMVKIRHNGEFGHVCSLYFGLDEAEVLCRTMGLSSRNVSYTFDGSGGYGLTYAIDCYGTEEDISECSISGGYNYCRHVALECGGTPVYLTYGQTELNGRLEAEYRGERFQFCPDDFGPNEARVACRMINNDTVDIAGTIGVTFPWRAYSNIINQVRCSGNESDISQCYSEPWGQGHCSSSQVVSLDCNTVRLVDGSFPYYGQAGRVEVYSDNGTWGTICDDSFDRTDARVICRMLGFNGNAETDADFHNKFPRGHGGIAIDELNCRGYEIDIADCPSNPWFQHDCSHSEDAGVVCYESGYATRPPYFPTQTTQTEANIRLVNGGYRSGRVEVYYHGQWGTVCDSNFDHADVNAVCRSLGMYRGESYGVAYYGAHFGEGQGNVVIEDLQCNGDEDHLGQCRSKTWLSNGCDHNRDVGVDCNAYRYGSRTTQRYRVISSGEYEGAVRLVNGYNSYSGRVEVFYNGHWGTVCDDSFDVQDAMVVCRVLGLYNGISLTTTYQGAYFGRGSGPIIIDDLQCSGNEWGLSQCSSNPWLSHNCGHGEDAGVDCYRYGTVARSTTRYPRWWETTDYYHQTTYTPKTNTPLYPWWRATTPYHYRTTHPPMPSLEQVIHVSCDVNGWDIRIDMYRLREIYPDAVASDIYLGENTCTGSGSWRYLTFHQGLRECLTSEVLRNDALVYSNELVYAERDPQYTFIIRNYNWTVGVECDIQRNETSSGHLHHDKNNLNEPQVTGSSHFPVNMSFYSDANFLHQLYGNPLHVSVGDKVYVKVYTTAPNWSVKMRVHTCYAKPSQFSTDSMKFFLVRNGCEVDTNTHIISQSAHETRFVFQDFEYTSNTEGIHVFCDAVFCGSHDYSRQCQQTCNPIIRRRSKHVENVESTTTATSEETTYFN